ncbi:MAG: Aminopeptidase YpdF (MP-, MA-, MS-, AP-, NP- specific) [Candidatus Saccharicenans subterraneus]|uniref:Aminopeptidase YpdF (MP-, MA-, MS-, AP-, NP-specific) n=1 Tax=Candidatus Saccharicenans subterraneus TaxID=2508984 RepID=A0A3E2BMI8_9BACT|nr:MAG: Aminopeptidase YpdF (MP-, MA-, MS-, AP-, NP- specific) [Candidatus Saccharicenans subterraneum]
MGITHMLIKEKTEQAVKILREVGLDCWITFTRESEICGDPSLVFLAPGHVTWHSAFIISAGGQKRAIVGLYDKKAIEDTGAYDSVDGYVTGIKEPLQKFLRELNPQKIAINYSRTSEICDGLTHGMYLTLHELLQEIGLENRLVPAERIVSSLRERKSPVEIDAIKRAIAVTEEIFELVRGFMAPGRSEKEIAGFMLDELKKRGLPTAWGQSTCPAVFTGPDTAQAHYSPTDRKAEPGHILNMDFGVKVDGYCSDMQRTFYLLQPGESQAPPEVRQGFETIVTAIEEARKAMKPGVQGVQVDAVARKIITGAGYQEFPHALGHQVGRFAHDGTALLGPAWEKYADKPFHPLEPGMVFTLEPRLTVPGRGVVTIEEMVVVTESGAEFLSHPQKDLLLIG